MRASRVLASKHASCWQRRHLTASLTLLSEAQAPPQPPPSLSSSAPTGPSPSVVAPVTFPSAPIVGPFRATPVRRVGRLPAAAPPINPHDPEYAQARRHFALTSRDDFLHTVHRFSRVNVDVHQRPVIHAYLSEAVVDKRMADLPAKTVHDMTHLAYVSGFHDLCLSLYHAKRHHNAQTRASPSVAAASLAGKKDVSTAEADHAGGESEAIAPSKKFVSNFLVSQYIVDSAYATESVVELLRIASYCAKCAEDDRAAGMAPEVMTSFSLFRALWRMVCLSEHFLQNEVAGTHSAGGTSTEALDAARVMLSDSILPFVQAHASSQDGSTVVSGQGTRAARQRLTEGTLDAFLRAVQRAVKYDTSGDDGEMFFFRRCLRTGCLVAPKPLSNANGARASSSLLSTHEGDVTSATGRPDTVEAEGTARAASVGPTGGGGGNIMTYVNDAELFYATLIDTCVAGRHTGAAFDYFESARHHCLGVQPTVPFLSNAGSLSANCASSAAPVGGTAAHGDAGRLQSTTLSEYVLYRLLAVLQQRKDNKRIVMLARLVIADHVREGSLAAEGDVGGGGAGVMGEQNPIGISVWSVFLISAGEARAADVAMAAFHYAQVRVRRAALASNERRGFEYLLQTSLNALSRCQLPHFEESYLAPMVEAEMVHCSRDFYFCCLLQDAHNAPNPAERAAALLARMEDEGVDRSVAVYSRLLKLYLRCESPLLLPTYKAAVAEHGLARRAWLDELIVWADRRRYFLSQEDRAFILGEVANARRDVTEGGSSPHRNRKERLDLSSMGGLRTQLALLEHDHAVQPLDYFFAHGEAPATEPTVLDSRAHFLLKRPQRILQGVNASDGCGRAPAARAVRGDAGELSDLAEKAELAWVAPLFLNDPPQGTADSAPGTELRTAAETEGQWREEAVRLYSVGMLKALQRSCNHMF